VRFDRAAERAVCLLGSGFAATVQADKVKAHTTTGGLGSALARSMGGESLFKVQWKNDDDREGFIGFTAPIPANIIPINMAEFPQVNIPNQQRLVKVSLCLLACALVLFLGFLPWLRTANCVLLTSTVWNVEIFGLCRREFCASRMRSCAPCRSTLV
jgi:hypothetical protein